MRILWWNGESGWYDVDSVKPDHPYQLVQYAVRRQLTRRLDWLWVYDFLVDDNNFMAKYDPRVAMQAISRAARYKFGIEVPRNVRHALLLDKKNNNHEWRDAIIKELQQIADYETFRVLDDDYLLSDEYQCIPYHIVFDVKFDLRRKARLVAGGNHTTPPKEDVYSGVVGMDSVRLGFIIATLFNLTVCAADVGNAFLYGLTNEKVYIIAGGEFGPELKGKRLLIVKSLYGLRTSAARFHEHISDKLRQLGFSPSKADSDLWIKSTDSTYEYIATYVDDVMIFAKDPMQYINALKDIYILKGVGTPQYYLGGDVQVLQGKWEEQGISTALSARTYIDNVLSKLEDMCDKQFPKTNTPMSTLYYPEMDNTELLDADTASKYRALIGSANWIITLGRFDIQFATQTLSRYAMAPRRGHFKAAMRIFGYLKRFPKGKIVLDPNKIDVSKIEFSNHTNWQEFYPDAEEEIDPDMPKPKGEPVQTVAYIDADHARDKISCRSITGILIFLNGTPLRFFCKRQKTVESSTYGSEIVAGKQATEIILDVRFTLRSLGLNVAGPSILLGDNKSVILNTTIPSSTLRKKHNAIAYHRIREAIAADIIKFGYIPSEQNFADLLTKPLDRGQFHNLVKPILFRNYDTKIEVIIERVKPTDPRSEIKARLQEWKSNVTREWKEKISKNWNIVPKKVYPKMESYLQEQQIAY